MAETPSPTPPTSPPVRHDRSLKTNGMLRMLMAAGVYVAVVALILAGAVVFRGKFLSMDCALTILRQITLIGIVAAGTSFVTMTGRYVDLSIPSLMAAVGFITITALPLGLPAALGCGLATGALLGGINGWVVGYLRLNPIIWTLAMNFLLIGLLRWIFAGARVHSDDAPAPIAHQFIQLAEWQLPGGIPLAAAVFAALALAAWWLMGRTLLGRQMRMTGAAYEAARLSGVPVRGVVLRAFIISGLTTAVAAIFLASQATSANFQLGTGRDFSAITAVVIGGVLLSGGAGNIQGVIGGVLLIGILEQLVTLAGGDMNTIMIVDGCVFIAVVGTTSWLARKGGRSHG